MHDGYIKTNDIKKKKSFLHIIGICAVALAIVLLVGVGLYQAGQPPVFTLSDNILSISSSFGETIYLKDIESLEMKDSLPSKLSKIKGSDLGSILKGHFKANGSNAVLFLDAAKPPFLYRKTTDGLTILNDQDQTRTERLYDKLKSKIK